MANSGTPQVEITQSELTNFKGKVTKYLSIDDEIKQLSKALREKRKEKLMLSNDVLNFMGEFNIEDLNTNTGVLKYSISKTKKTISKKDILEKLTAFLKNSDKASEAISYIYDNREVVEKVRLKRLKPRKNMNL